MTTILGPDTQEVLEETSNLLLAAAFDCRHPKDQNVFYAELAKVSDLSYP
jgi:hypothetical protein